MLQCSQRIECGRNHHLQPPHQAARDHALRQPPEHAAQSDIHVDDVQNVAVLLVLDLESDVGDAHHFAALAVDDLLVQKIAHQPQHVFVGMIRRQQLVFEVNAVERYGANLVVPYGEPGPAAAQQETIHAGRMNQRNDRGVFDEAEAAALQVIDLEAQQFGKEEEFVRHRESPIFENRALATTLAGSGRSSGAPYMIMLLNLFTMPQSHQGPQQKNTEAYWKSPVKIVAGRDWPVGR